MPARSAAQRRLLNARFGHEWVKEHGFDNKGKLPEKKRAANRKAAQRRVRRRRSA